AADALDDDDVDVRARLAGAEVMDHEARERAADLDLVPLVEIDRLLALELFAEIALTALGPDVCDERIHEECRSRERHENREHAERATARPPARDAPDQESKRGEHALAHEFLARGRPRGLVVRGDFGPGFSVV